MWPRFGIKIGNSTVCIAAAKDDGKIEVIANKQGDRVSPACLLSEGDEIEVGTTAKLKMASKLGAVVANNLLLFPNDLTEEQIENSLKYISCKFNRNTNKYDLISVGDDKSHRSISPYEVCVEFFKASFELARQYHLSEEHPSVVLSVPDYYPHDCWQELAKAAEEAGFHVAQIINEPSAAVLAYEIGEKSTDELAADSNGVDDNETTVVLFMKSGGICSSFTLLEIYNGIYSVIESAGPFHIGGKEVTDSLVNFITKEFYKKYRLDPLESRRSVAKIRTVAENCKHILTTLPSTQIYIDSLMDGIDFNVQMSQARFDSLIQPVLNEFIGILNTALTNINKDNRKIDQIVLAGATLKIPKIQKMIQARFPDAILNTKFSADEVVAIGCARQSIFLINPDKQDLEQITHLSFTTNDIYIWQDNENDQPNKQLLCKKGTILPNVFRMEFDIIEESPVIVNNCDSEDDADKHKDNSDQLTFQIGSLDEMCQVKCSPGSIKSGKLCIKVDVQLNENRFPTFSLQAL